MIEPCFTRAIHTTTEQVVVAPSFTIITTIFGGALLPDTEMGFALFECSQARSVSELSSETPGPDTA